MCINSIFFFDFFFFKKFSKFVLIYFFYQKNFNSKNFNKIVKPVYHFPIFLAYKFNVVNLYTSNSFLYSKIFFTIKKFSVKFLFVSQFFLKTEYKKFINIFFFFFLNNVSILLLSFKHFLFELLNLNSIINNVKIYNILNKLFLIKKNVIIRNKFATILYYILNLFDTKMLFLFDFNYSFYIYKIFKKSSRILGGIQFPYYKSYLYDIPLYFFNNFYFIKLLLLNQLNDVY
jgi:hypothetical protein